jgi:hypothetical protein
MKPGTLMKALQQLVPGMPLGTARRLVDLKYGRPAETDLLGPASSRAQVSVISVLPLPGAP